MDTECLVLSPDFKLPDENQILLRVPRQNNMYSFNLENIVPTGGLACLIAKATVDESNKWHRRLGHVNFKNLNKFVKGILSDVYLLRFFKMTTPVLLVRKESNTSNDHLGKFDGKSDEGLLVGYSLSSKAFRSSYTLTITSSKAKNGGEKPKKDIGLKSNEKPVDQEEKSFLEELERLKRQEKKANDEVEALRKESAQDDSQIPALEDIYDQPSNEIFSNASYDDEGAVADCINLETTMNKVWILADLHFGKKAIGTKCIYKNKKDERGVVVINKSRLVTRGHRQEEGKDYDEVFAHVARIEAIKIFLAFASYMGFIVYHMDVKSAFLYGKIDGEVYVSQPSGFIDPKFLNKVYKVVKALYGLHQAPRAWYATLSTFLVQSGYRRGLIDKILFIKKDKKDIMLVQVYVDDIIFGSTKKSLCDEFEALIKNSVKSASTPIETKKPLVMDEEATDVDVHLYRFMMYLTASRHDIMYAVYACSRFQVTPKTLNLQVVKRIFRRRISWHCKKQTIVATSTTKAVLGMRMQFDLVLEALNEGTNRNERDQVQSPHDSPLSGGHTSDRAEGALILEELLSIYTNLYNKVLALETIKDTQAAEIIALKAQIKKLEKKCKPSISHHRAWLQKEPVNEGRLSKEISQDKGSGEKRGSAKELVSTTRPEDSTVRPDMKEEKSKENGVSNKGIEDSSRPARSILTLKPLLTIDLKDKGKGVLEEPEPTKKMTRSDLDATQIAKDAKVARLVYKEELAHLEREKEKRQREEKASKAAIAKMYDEVQAGIEADALFAAKLQ
uniref:Retrovirus-related Pol polyprotein from transposon TNT 1-94 n=1 Tax=Tanacetum cinerariifolium TaxID=118510 RepID=A0A6L2M953_TANCI|nr:retrovirus-related Pol polyprotein from transposon TNT 1-94 [Tanacetum cinerariifolium]